MTPQEFARKHFGPHRIHGGEIKPRLCPYCNGGSHRDTYTFALNIEKGTFNCKRGSCNKAGSFKQLLADFGEAVDEPSRAKWECFQAPPKKSYAAPKSKTTPAGSAVESYLTKRGISKATWEARGVCEHNGAIAFPYHENGKRVLMKFRKPQKYTGQGQKAWREEGGKAVFWGMDNCDPSIPLVIVEGEFDALALDEAGLKNVVSVPSGAKDLTCVENCWEWLEKFNKVIIWPDSDDPGQEMARKLVNRLGKWRCSLVVSEHKDANEALFKDGKESLKAAIKHATEVPIAGLLRLADVASFDLDSVVRVKSSITGLNRVLGGYMMGQVSVWTGVNSSGKSTFLGQELIEAIDQGFAVCAYSGELPAPVFRYWIELQAAGPDYLIPRTDSFREAPVFYPTQEAKEAMRSWYRDKFFLIDALGGVTTESLLEIFEYAARRYDCKVFLVDNLMSMVASGGKEDYYHKQSEFIGKMVDFTHNFNVHAHIVAHPRKSLGRLSKMDVAGSADITNRADNVFALHRVSSLENQLRHEEGKEEIQTIVDVFKNRFSGKQDVEVELLFDDDCKRFGAPTNPDWGKVYGWANR